MGDDVEREEVGDAIEGDVGNAELGDEMEQLYKECNSIRNEDQWDFLLRLDFFFFFFKLLMYCLVKVILILSFGIFLGLFWRICRDIKKKI